MEIKDVKIEELRHADYNPRELSPKEEKNLRNSLKKYGFAEPIIVNSSEERKNIIIGGHQRVRVAKEIGIDVVPVAYMDLPIEKERELNLYLNRNYGKWDYAKLGGYDREVLSEVGFGGEELKKIDEYLESKKIIEGEEEFTTELLEENNYVLFAFDNVLDWQRVADALGLKTVNSLDSKEGYKRKGVGRILKGGALLKLIENNGDSNPKL